MDTAMGARTRNGRSALTAADWRILIAVAVAQVVAAAALRAMPLSVLRVTAARLRRFARFVVIGSDDHVVWAIQATGRRLGGLSSCLVRALVTDLVLGSPERPLCLTIGVRRTASGTLEAHAWVESGDRVLIGATSDDYVLFVGWNSLSA